MAARKLNYSHSDIYDTTNYANSLYNWDLLTYHKTKTILQVDISDVTESSEESLNVLLTSLVAQAADV